MEKDRLFYPSAWRVAANFAPSTKSIQEVKDARLAYWHASRFRHTRPKRFEAAESHAENSFSKMREEARVWKFGELVAAETVTRATVSKTLKAFGALGLIRRSVKVYDLTTRGLDYVAVLASNRTQMEQGYRLVSSEPKRRVMTFVVLSKQSRVGEIGEALGYGYSVTRKILKQLVVGGAVAKSGTSYSATDWGRELAWLVLAVESCARPTGVGDLLPTDLLDALLKGHNRTIELSFFVEPEPSSSAAEVVGGVVHALRGLGFRFYKSDPVSLYFVLADDPLVFVVSIAVFEDPTKLVSIDLEGDVPMNGSYVSARLGRRVALDGTQALEARADAKVTKRDLDAVSRVILLSMTTRVAEQLREALHLSTVGQPGSIREYYNGIFDIWTFPPLLSTDLPEVRHVEGVTSL